MPTPEEKARQEIDRQLAACGWLVQDFKSMHITAALGVAVREFQLKTGDADYLLYADGKAIGVVEAKPVGHTLTGVEIQSSKYTLGLPDGIPIYRKPLPFAYESTGAVTQFTNSLEPDFRSREVFTFHRPDELIRLAGLAKQVRANLRAMPELTPIGYGRPKSSRCKTSKRRSPPTVRVHGSRWRPAAARPTPHVRFATA